MKRPVKTILASIILLGLNASAYAGGGGGNTQLAATLTAVSPLTTEGSGTGFVSYTANSKNGGNGSLQATINLPVGTAPDLLIDSNTAAASTFIITLNGTVTCNMVIKEINFIGGEMAQFTLAVSEKNGVYSEQIGGSCSPASFPVLLATDTVSVALSTASSTPLLTGTLAAHH